MTRITRTALVALLAAVLFSPGTARATVEAKVFNTITTEAAPIDIATSADGVWTFVLGTGGKIFIYSADGQLNDIIDVEPTADRIFVAGDNRLFVSSGTKKNVQLIALTFSANIEITGAPFIGQENAPIVVVLFSDFECPFCAKLGEEMEKILAKNPETVKVVYKHYPLPSHKFAALAALAATAAHQQGKFWQFHDLLFKNQTALSQQKLLDIAKEVKLDMDQFNKDLSGTEIKDKLSKDIKDGQGAGVKGTPSVFVNGRESVKLDAESIQQLIDNELKIVSKRAPKP